MKKLNVLAMSIAIAAGTLTSGAAVAGASANIGYTSDYFFRGIYQTYSSASGGLDYAHDSGLYVGTWWADVDEGLETDYYAGFGGEASGLSYDIGYYVYDYTDDFDDKYSEVLLSVGYGPISVEYAVGEYDTTPVTQDYTFAAITAEYEGLYIKFGTWGDEFEGDYTEVGYGTEIGGFEVGVAIINNDEFLDIKPGGANDGETAMTFSLAKSFDL